MSAATSGTTTPRATLEMVTIDCGDPGEEARFWAALLGGEVTYADANYGLVSVDGRRLGFGAVEGWKAPGWPNTSGTKQFHLDVSVDDPEAAADAVCALGATRPAHQPGDGWVVLLDPAGHPFCLTKKENWAGM